jgi:hypothetical protein
MDMQEPSRNVVEAVLFSPEGAGGPSDWSVFPGPVADKLGESVVEQAQPRPNLWRVSQRLRQWLLELVGLTKDRDRDSSLL